MSLEDPFVRKHLKKTHISKPTIQVEETEYPTIVEDPQMVLVSISRLPNDILLDILTRLSIKTIFACRCVCKTWRKIIQSPRFTKLHHDMAQQRCTQIPSLIIYHNDIFDYKLPSELYLRECQNYDNLSDDGGDFDKAMILNTQFNRWNLGYEVVGSCNGLLCLSEPLYYDPIYVCNPVIGEYMTLPSASMETSYDIVSGFGFDSAKNEYKVVRMLYCWIDNFDNNGPNFELQGEVYTIGSGSWRSIGNVRYPLRGNFSPEFVNGVLHWLPDSHVSVDTSELIVGFDVGREEFRVLIPPPDYRHRQARHNFDLSLRELGGQLCLVDFTPEEHLVIWVMKEYGVGASWRKEYVVERPLIGLNRKFIGPLCLMKNEKILFSCSGGTFMRYDPVDQRFQVLRIQGLPPHYCLFTHVGSLVSLRDAERITSEQGGRVDCGRWSTTHPDPFHNSKWGIPVWQMKKKKDSHFELEWP